MRSNVQRGCGLGGRFAWRRVPKDGSHTPSGPQSKPRSNSGGNIGSQRRVLYIIYGIGMGYTRGPQRESLTLGCDKPASENPTPSFTSDIQVDTQTHDTSPWLSAWAPPHDTEVISAGNEVHEVGLEA